MVILVVLLIHYLALWKEKEGRTLNMCALVSSRIKQSYQHLFCLTPHDCGEVKIRFFLQSPLINHYLLNGIEKVEISSV